LVAIGPGHFQIVKAVDVDIKGTVSYQGGLMAVGENLHDQASTGGNHDTVLKVAVTNLAQVLQ
jgi:hypothetical protein